MKYSALDANRVTMSRSILDCLLSWIFEQRALAVAMGFHERLGQECAFACMPVEMLVKSLNSGSYSYLPAGHHDDDDMLDDESTT